MKQVSRKKAKQISNLYFPKSMPEVKGNRMQFLKHVLWLHQLKPNDSTRKRNCKYSLASSSKKIGQYEEANSHAALTSFCVEHKIKPWVKK